MTYFTIKKLEGVAVVYLDQPKSPVNVLSADMLDGFKKLLDDLESDKDVKSVVIYSRKKDCWIAGAALCLAVRAAPAVVSHLCGAQGRDGSRSHCVTTG